MKVEKRNMLLQIIVMIVLLILVIGITYTCFKSKNKKLNKQNISNGALSIMLENENGEYEKNERTTWPTEEEGYYFSYSLSYCENGSTLSWEDNKVRLKTAGSDKCYAYFSHTKEDPIDPSDPNDPSTSGSGSSNPQERLLADQDQVIKLHYESLLHHDDQLENGAHDDSYRYSGASDEVPNYVCLDNKEEIVTPIACANDDLYRIIGLFKNDNSESDDYEQYEIKLIKSDYATTTQLGSSYSSTVNRSSFSAYKGELVTIPVYNWASNGVNKWDGASLNNALNTTFKSYLEKQKPGISQHIEEYNWKVAGNTWSNIAEQTVVTAYKNEIENATGGNGVSANTTYPAQIGLMYVSDYGYAAHPDYWTTKLYASNSQDYRLENVRNNNWMYMGIYEWTTTRHADYSHTALGVDREGRVDYYVVNQAHLAVRPSFYLKSSTKIASGSGRKDDPYRISW